MTLPLTEAQERVWRYIKSCDRSPSYRQMAKDLDYRSTNAVHRITTELEERGYIARLRNRARSLVALEPHQLAAFPTEVLQAEIERRLAA